MGDIAENLAEIRERIERACQACGRSADEVRLLAVSKTFPSASVLEAFEAGQVEFGESRQQEGSEKVHGLPDAMRWHFIGKLQRNKVRKVLADFAVIQSVDSLKLAAHIDRIAGEEGLRPEVFLEVNVAGEESKGGFGEDELREVFPEISALRHLDIRGLMAIPPDEETPEAARPWFAKVRDLRDELSDAGEIKLPELSMGMSGDFEVAIEEGSTMVRVGTAIFGGR